MKRVGCRVYNLSGQGLTSYQEAWRWQKALSERSSELYKRGEIVTDSLLLVQHSSTYSLGKGATPTNLKFKADDSCPHDLFRVERGGEVTWHGPGQLVVYPIFNLNNHKKDLHWFTTQLEQTSIETIGAFGIQGERSEVNTGVWVGRNKISAVGLTASRWVTMHGIALNVSCDLSHFQQIVPCGIALPDRGVCSIHSELGGLEGAEAPNLPAVAQRWVRAFEAVFDLQMSEAEDTAVELANLVAEYPLIANTELVQFRT